MGKGNIFLALLVSCFLAQVLSALTPSDPRVGCPSGYVNPTGSSPTWFLNYGASSHWGGLCPAYATCSTGFAQSPLSIPTANITGRNNVSLHLSLSVAQPVSLIRYNNYLVMPISGSNTLNWKNLSYTLNSIEFHTPSEHILNGRYANLEVQLYFSYTDRRGTFQAAIAFLYNCGSTCDDAFFSKILPALPPNYTPRSPYPGMCMCGNNRTEPYNPYGAEQCDEGPLNGNTPNQCRSNCKFPTCGDGVLDNTWSASNPEQCDNGAANNLNISNSCRTNCRLPCCGDGIVDSATEACDNGNMWWEGSGCTGSCQLECGDGCLQPNEQCDYGSPATHPLMNNNLNGTYTSTCRLNCLWARCGDGILDYPEQCDNGTYSVANNTGSPLNTNNYLPNSCRPNCTLPVCGDGVVDPFYGEQCEPSLSNIPSGLWLCTPNCRWACGDGIIEANNSEACDNGTLNSNAGWTGVGPLPCRTFTPTHNFSCQYATCGDGIVDLGLGEQCDSYGILTWLCYPNCTLRCGNNYIEPPIGGAPWNETCDNGNPQFYPLRINDGNNNTRPSACRDDCQLPTCGDGITDPVNCEQCDNGNPALLVVGVRYTLNFSGPFNSLAPNAGCRPTCKFPWCGDGIVDTNYGEQCDDGNNFDDDGCSCCEWDCGNGIKQGAEDCDDGAANSNVLPDRCRNNVGGLKCIRHFCGDDVTDSNEECDDTATGSWYCTPNCKRTFCGDGVVQTQLGEECDNGNANSYSALGGCSPVCTLNLCGQTISSQTVNLQSLFPSFPNTSGYSAYVGSLTRPPCTEGVQWFVYSQVRTMTNEQCAWYRSSVTGTDSRCAQADHSRLPTWAQIQPTTGIGSIPKDPRAIPVCGDGIVQQGEQCDNGMYFNDNHAPDACRTNCMANRCGDGVTDANEQCDGGSYCSPVCTLIHRTQLAPVPSDALFTVANQGLWDEYGTCSGLNQSPIRLPQACPSARALNLNNPANVQYNPTPIVLFNTGSNILFPQLAGGTFSYQGTTYNLYKVEFHQPSEHYIGNTQFPFEVQLFHQSTVPGSKQLAILSVLFSEGPTCNSVLQPILDRLPRVSHCSCGNGIKEDINANWDGTWVKEECDDGPLNNDHLPNRCRTSCMMAYCGDNVVDSKEFCDDGPYNNNSANRCRTTCVLPFCGDNIVDDMWGETCDDGNNVNGDGCNSNCQVECGDGVKGQNEQCDNGIYNSNTACGACRKDCTVARCGDSVIDVNLGEACDDGVAANALSPNACRPNCNLPFCGDNIIDTAYGETCDGGPLCYPPNSSRPCTLYCGDGIVEGNEACDNGPANSNTVPNACRTNCKLPSCGDNVRDDGEACDQGPNNIYCSGCQVQCGSGILDVGEECDNGIYNSNNLRDGCRTNCLLWHCGDGVLDSLEECDNGGANANTSDACRPWCRIPTCGDGIVDVLRGETCDDGNTEDGDGCSCTCHKECGNGRIDPGEVCDAGAANSDTTPACCRTTCTLPYCGDGVVDPGEQCDDGTARNIDGPNSCRPDCTLPYCGDGIVDYLFGELCDQGSRNSLTAIDGCNPGCLPNLCSQSVNLNTTVNVGGFLPTTPGTYMYQGSLNSPPCQETATWFVFATPSPICGCQLTQFTSVLANNNRCLQARNGRPVNYLQVTAKCGDGIVEGNEQCDNGPANSDYAPNACRRNCLLPHCGDGVQDQGEQCDGTPNCSQTCTFNCPGLNTTASGLQQRNINVNFADVLANNP